jgi:hypothetical protein
MIKDRDTFTIKDSLELPRAGSVLVNPAGSLFMVFLAQANLGSKYVCQFNPNSTRPLILLADHLVGYMYLLLTMQSIMLLSLYPLQAI